MNDTTYPAIESSPCKDVFARFREMNQIPRGSGNEKGVSDWLCQFAKARGLEVIQDKAWNVIIRVPGTPGYEDAETVILQGHMDMVPEKEDDSDHDFTKDPIAFLVDGDFVHADKTTLGADNGIAVAYALTIADTPSIPHPPLEILVTTSEETGMDGASALDPKSLKGRRLINIDSEEEGKLLVSCAGGLEVNLTIPCEREVMPDAVTMSVTVEGLQGGHSGMEIDKQRGSANRLVARLVHAMVDTFGARLVAFDGGTKHNAIPRRAEALVAVPKEARGKIDAFVSTWHETFKNELAGVDDGVVVRASEAQTSCDPLSAEATRRAIMILYTIPIGVINMSQAIKGLVQTSNNMAIVRTTDVGLEVKNSVRSSIRSCKEDVAQAIRQIGEVAGAKVDIGSSYPEWQYQPTSKLRDVFVAAYKELYGKEPEISAIHAGLECGLFSEKFDGKIDLISFGPNLFDVHTPKERMSISSVERTWTYLKKVLSMLK